MELDPGTPGSRPGLKAGAKLLSHLGCPLFLFFFKIYLIILERERKIGGGAEREAGRGRSRLHAGSLMWNSIPGPLDHDLSQRLNH